MKNEFKLIGISLLFGLVFSFIVAARMYAYSEKTQTDIASNVIRFHVKANSDLPQDQSVKNAVRERVLQSFEKGLSAANSVEETRAFINANMAEIIACASETAREWGYDYPVTASIEKSFFPTRVYGDVIFPPGEYEALCIVLGEGAGTNWWCLLFPPLCYVDMAQDVPEASKEQLMRLLPEEGYKLLTYRAESGDASFEIKFKIVEWWQNRKEPFLAEGQYILNN